MEGKENRTDNNKTIMIKHGKHTNRTAKHKTIISIKFGKTKIELPTIRH